MAELASCTIYIKGISTTATEADVRDACSKYGNITEVAIPEGKDFCFVEFAEEAQAQVGPVSSAARSDKRGKHGAAAHALLAAPLRASTPSVPARLVSAERIDLSVTRHQRSREFCVRSLSVSVDLFLVAIARRKIFDAVVRSSLARWCRGVAGRFLRVLVQFVYLASACVALVGAPFSSSLGSGFLSALALEKTKKPISSSPAFLFGWCTDAASSI